MHKQSIPSRLGNWARWAQSRHCTEQNRAEMQLESMMRWVWFRFELLGAIEEGSRALLGDACIVLHASSCMESAANPTEGLCCRTESDIGGFPPPKSTSW